MSTIGAPDEGYWEGVERHTEGSTLLVRASFGPRSVVALARWTVRQSGSDQRRRLATVSTRITCYEYLYYSNILLIYFKCFSLQVQHPGTTVFTPRILFIVLYSYYDKRLSLAQAAFGVRQDECSYVRCAGLLLNHKSLAVAYRRCCQTDRVCRWKKENTLADSAEPFAQMLRIWRLRPCRSFLAG